MRRCERAAVVLALTLAISRGAAAQQPSLDHVLDRMAEYLRVYESQLSDIVGVERYQQREYGREPLGNFRAVRSIAIESEIAFLRLPGDGYWYGVRETKAINKKPIRTQTHLVDLVPGSNLAAKRAAIMAESSSHNLGQTRNINMPTVPLEVVQTAWRDRLASFRDQGSDRIRGVRTRRIAFDEIGESTLISHFNQFEDKVRGLVWVEEANGRVWRAEIDCREATLARDSSSFLVRVDFDADKALGVLVPIEMNETFPATVGGGDGRALYSNFRKFQTSARLVPQQDKNDSELQQILNKLSAYLSSYEEQLGAVVADERFEQRLDFVGGVVGSPALMPPAGEAPRRAIDSEIAFVPLPGSGVWYGFRDTKRVDGKSVSASNVSLREALAASKDPVATGLKITQESSKHNLGVVRTINMPTVVLELLADRQRERFDFNLGSRERVAGVETRRLNFQEAGRPTFLVMPSGDQVVSAGTVWLEPASGKVWRAELVYWSAKRPVQRPAVNDPKIRVEFRPDSTLGFLVPVEMRESFASGEAFVGTRRSEGTGKATYSNFRRFQTSARIIPEPQ